MRTLQVVQCSDTDHKVKCFMEVRKAIDVVRRGGETRNGRKVTIRGEITDPCACHLDAALYFAGMAIGERIAPAFFAHTVKTQGLLQLYSHGHL